MSDGRLPARRRWIRWVIGAVVALLILATGWVIVRGAGAIGELRNIERSASQLRTSIAAGDLNRVGLVAPRVSDHAALAHALTSDPIWRTFEIVPWIGNSFTAMREIADVADDVAEDSVAAVLDASADLDLATLGFTGSKVDLVAFGKIEASLADAAKKLSAAELRAQQIDTDGVITPFTDAVRDMRDAITGTATTVGALHDASILLPSMLGSDAPRHYVVVTQNNADVRTHGGSADSFTLIRADDGALSIVHQASANDFQALQEPLPLSDSTITLFEDRPGRVMQDVTSIPNFAEAGPVIAARWTQQFRGTVDGVIAIDALVAQHLLEATGPVPFSSYTANTETVLPILLSGLYADVPDSAQQHSVFALAAQSIFTAGLRSGEPQKLIGALAAAADENRIRIWSAHPEEEEILAGSSLGGTIPKDGERGTYVGVFFNDRTGGQMSYYTEAAISTAVGICHGEPTTEVQVTWTNNASIDPEEPLPASVTGPQSEELTPGDTRTLITIYGPEGASAAGADDSAQRAVIDSRDAVQHEVQLSPGESTTISVSFVGEGAGEHLTHVQHTPLIGDPPLTRKELVCDG